MHTLCISNVSLGYGSPQILNLVKSIVDYYGSSDGLILEPNQPQRQAQKNTFNNMEIKRIYTSQLPWSEQWKIEYVRRCARIADEIKPDVLILIDAITLPIIELIKEKPKKIIYYSLEMAEYFGLDEATNYLLDVIVKDADLILFPEENREKEFLKQFPKAVSKAEVIMNCPSIRLESKGGKKNGKIIYQGTIDKQLTFSEYYLKKKVNKYEIDMFGLIEGEGKTEIENQLMKGDGNVSYMGYVDNAQLAKIRSLYSYGIVNWNPINKNFLFAAPNKLFEYISDGVVPIAAPHPQCEKIIHKYDCGVLMLDWTFKSFCKALKYAMKISGTEQYMRLQRNCKLAYQKELNWEKQVSKVYQYL